MRGAWGTLVTVGAFLVMGVMATSMASDYLDTHGTFFANPGGEVNLAMATLGRMRTLIGQLQVR
jgi:hypothetical protein